MSLKYESVNHSDELNPSLIFIERCNYYKNKQTSSNWDGVYRLDRK